MHNNTLLRVVHCRDYLRYTVFKVRRRSFSFLAESGGDNEIRTHDPLLARQVLSQLSYTPMSAKRMPFRR